MTDTDKNVPSEYAANIALLNTESYNNHSPAPIVAVCIAASLTYTAIAALLGLFNLSSLHHYLGPPFICCFVSAALAEKMRVRSAASVGMYLIFAILCYWAARPAGVAYAIYFETAIAFSFVLMLACVSEGIVGLCLNDKYSINLKAGLVRALFSAVFVTILSVQLKMVPSYLMALPGASMMFFIHLAIWAKLRAVVEYSKDEELKIQQ